MEYDADASLRRLKEELGTPLAVSLPGEAGLAILGDGIRQDAQGTYQKLAFIVSRTV